METRKECLENEINTKMMEEKEKVEMTLEN